jgi:metallo-beta-lactamase family protein
LKITFLGAAQTVTGSKFLLECGASRVLIDCGLFQERDLRSRNWEKFPVNPAKIQALLLTHAHIDHCGYLPRLVKEGFQGKIYCTAPTEKITKLSLLDSAELQEADAEFKMRRHKKEQRKGPYPERPLYTTEDVKKIFSHFRTISYEKPFSVVKNITATFFPAGHILGAAMIELKVIEENREQTIVFSGDIGRWDRPLLCDPHIFQKADYVVMEATYGDRLHEDEESSRDRLEQVINSTHQKGGNIIIPSFAIGRTQELLYDLNQLLKEERIPPLMTFVDSPMAFEVTKISEQYADFFDSQAKEVLVHYQELFDFPLLKFTSSVKESKAINHLKGTVIVMAGSGMCTGGRIKHHLANNISRPESTILFVGYQAYGTLGREILEKPREVRILGMRHQVLASIEKINGLSAHADQRELLRWFTGFGQATKKVFIVHSEKPCAQKFVEALTENFTGEVVIPSYLEEYEI